MGFGNRRTSVDHLNDSIFEFCRIEETCCHSDSNGKSSANAGVKNFQMSKIIIIMIIIIVVGALGTVPKNLKKRLGEQEIKGRTVTILATALVKTARTVESML